MNTPGNGDRIRIGGLMRCCILTLDERTDPGREGDVQPCKYCSDSMRFRNGAWEWNRPAEVSGSPTGATPMGGDVEFVDVGPETDDGEPVRMPWRFDVPEPPASVTALKDRDGDVWLRLSRSKWSGASWPGDSRSFADLLDFAPLVECDDPRAAS